MALARKLTAPRMIVIGRALTAEKGLVSPALQKLVNDPTLWISIQTRAALVLGIIFLKIATPGLGGSLLTIVVAIVIGIASALPAFRSVRAQEGSPN
jgi:hypothetical protein